MTAQIISKAGSVAENKKARGLAEVENIPRATFEEGFDINEHINVNKGVAEFVASDDFASAFYTRQRYEVDAGRDEEPLLYMPIYDEVVDASLPRTLNINTLGTGGVVFKEIKEGGEVVFATIGEGSKSVTLLHHAVGLSYTEDLFLYNELWRLPNIERVFGIAHNALLNHIHFNPILAYTYAAANKTDGTALTDFNATDELPLKYLHAIEAAITAAVADNRRGPYSLVVSTSNLFTVERALNIVAQQGFSKQSSAISRISNVIAYDGWTGTRGKKSTTYSGVTAGTG